MDERPPTPEPGAAGPTPGSEDPQREIERLKAQLEHRREEIDYYRDQLLATISQQIDARATRLEEEIKGRFFGSVKVASWIIGLVFVAATAGGFYNAWREIPEMVNEEVAKRVGEAVSARTAGIEEELRVEIDRKLLAIEREVSGRIQDSARAELARFEKALGQQREDAARIGADVRRLVQPLDLLASAKAGDLERVTALLDARTEVGIRDARGRTPLILAALGGHAEVVSLLLERGADVNDRDWDGKSALIHAAENGYADVAEVLLARGAEADVADRSNRTALIHAAANGHEGVVDKLILYSDLERAGPNGTTALLEAIERRQDKVTDVLLMSGANPNAQRADGDTALILATYQGNERLVADLLDRGADPCARGRDGRTAAMIARDFGREAIRDLLSRRASACPAGGGGG